jgi:hypothetical protein
VNSRELQPGVDALFVEGSDDGAFTNAFVKRCLDVDLAHAKLVKLKERGGGVDWAMAAFKKFAGEAHAGARVGLIVDRDQCANDKKPAIETLLRELRKLGRPAQFDVWMWPDNSRYGALEDLVESIIPAPKLLEYAREACEIAKQSHDAEYNEKDAKKASLKVRSIWCDASAAGGYGHLIHNLKVLNSPPAAVAFLEWFKKLFLAE